MILLKSDPSTLRLVADALLEKKIVIIPTDTVYGFSGIVPDSANAIKNIKGRGEEKPFIQLVAHVKDIELYSPTKIPEKVAKHMPGPLTVIVKNNFDDKTTAYRCPNDVWLQELISLCNCPLYSTSTNRSQQPILSKINEMEREFGNEVYCIVDGNIGTNESSKPSTIIDISNGEITIVRQGDLYI